MSLFLRRARRILGVHADAARNTAQDVVARETEMGERSEFLANMALLQEAEEEEKQEIGEDPVEIEALTSHRANNANNRAQELHGEQEIELPEEEAERDPAPFWHLKRHKEERDEANDSSPSKRMHHHNIANAHEQIPSFQYGIDGGIEKKFHVQRVWVGGLSRSVLAQDLHNIFQCFGAFVGVTKVPGSSFAYVEFNHPDNAFLAIQSMNQKLLDGKKMNVEWATHDRGNSSELLLTSTGYPSGHEELVAHAMKALNAFHGMHHAGLVRNTFSSAFVSNLKTAPRK